MTLATLRRLRAGGRFVARFGMATSLPEYPHVNQFVIEYTLAKRPVERIIAAVAAAADIAAGKEPDLDNGWVL